VRPSRVRTLLTVAAGGLAVLSVRPIPRVEEALDHLLLPTRFLAELASPVGWLQGREARAEDPRREARRQAEIGEQERLESAILEMADPADTRLLARLGSIHLLRAEVIARPAEDLDRLVVRVEDPSIVHDDLPVVSGDCYVGRIDLAATRDDRSLPVDQFVVQLVTGREFRTGARVEGRDCRLVIGGIAALPGLRLDVHNPSDRSVESGTVVIDEPPFAEGRGDLANGFRLGSLCLEAADPDAPDELAIGVAPELDYATGLHQVLVLVPPSERAPAPVPTPPLLEDGRWLSARLFLRAEPSSWREGRKLALGRHQGVETGAALASGPRLAGIVLHAGLATADVALLGDPGLVIPALALYSTADGERPHVLGRLTCLGRRGDTVRLHWPATIPLDATLHGEGPVPARVWTGSGEAGIPRGLLLGDVELPVGPGPHVLSLRLPDGGGEPGELSLRLGQEQLE